MSKKHLLLSVLSLLLFNIIFAAENYTVGDTLYVWAKNGMNLRADANTKSKVKQKLAFGDFIVVQEKTLVNYKELFPLELSTVSLDPKPKNLILRGNWVKVISSNGIEGYLVDPYLLKYRPKYIYTNNGELNIKETKRYQTFKAKPSMKDGELRSKETVFYEHNIVAKITYADYILYEYEFESYSIQDCLILMMSRDDIKFAILEKNLDTNLIIWNDSCDYNFKKIKSKHKILLKGLCAC